MCKKLSQERVHLEMLSIDQLFLVYHPVWKMTLLWISIHLSLWRKPPFFHW